MGSTGMRRVRFMMVKSISAVKYGYLYNWYATQGTGNNSIIPSAMESVGWVVPTTDNYYAYIDAYIGNGGSTSAQKLKESGTTYWNVDNGTNLYNFNWRGAGYRDSVGNFVQLKQESELWCYDPKSSILGYVYYANTNSSSIGYISPPKAFGCSIRLMRSATVAEQLQADGTVTQNGYTGNDGLKYPIVKIGTQMWMVVNLAETKLRDGSDIPNVTDNATWIGSTSIIRCAYNNNNSNVFL